MSPNGVHSEQDVLTQVTDDFKRKGYDIVIGPRFHDLPEFLREYQPDALARGKDEVVVIEVKFSGSAGDGPRLRKMAEEIARHPGWRLHVILGPSRDEADEDWERLPVWEVIESQTQAAERLFEAGEKVPSILVLWSLLEAASLRRLYELGVERSGPQSPTALIKDLISFGYLEETDHDEVERIADLRNSLAHGRLDMEITDRVFGKLKQLVWTLVKDKD